MVSCDELEYMFEGILYITFNSVTLATKSEFSPATPQEVPPPSLQSFVVSQRYPFTARLQTPKMQSSSPRRSPRLAQKPKVTYSEQPRSLLIRQAFATPVSDRTDDQHLLVDDVLQDLAKARYMKELIEFYHFGKHSDTCPCDTCLYWNTVGDHHSLCSCYDCWEYGDYYYEDERSHDDYDPELDPDHEPLEKVLAFEQSDIMKRMIAAGNPPMFMMSSYK